MAGALKPAATNGRTRKPVTLLPSKKRRKVSIPTQLLPSMPKVRHGSLSLLAMLPLAAIAGLPSQRPKTLLHLLLSRRTRRSRMMTI